MGVGGQRHAPAALPPVKTRYPLYKKLGGPQGRSWRVWENLASIGIRSPDIYIVNRVQYQGPRKSYEGLTRVWPSDFPSHHPRPISKQNRYLRIHSKGYSPPWNANSTSHIKEFAYILWNPKVHHSVHNSPPPAPTQNNINKSTTSRNSPSKIYSNNIFSSNSRYSKWSISSRFPDQNSVRISLPTRATCPANSKFKFTATSCFLKLSPLLLILPDRVALFRRNVITIRHGNFRYLPNTSCMSGIFFLVCVCVCVCVCMFFIIFYGSNFRVTSNLQSLSIATYY